MNIIIKTINFFKSLIIFQEIIKKKQSMNILNGILIKTDFNSIIINATNSDTSLSNSVKCNIKKEGAVCVSGKIIFNIFKILQHDYTEIFYCKKRLHISSGKIKISLLTYDSQKYPKIPIFSSCNEQFINNEKFIKMAKKTLYCTSNDRKRKNLNGIYLKTYKNNIFFISTDGYRLSLIKEKLNSNFLCKNGMILPKSSILELLKVLEMEENRKDIPKINILKNEIIFSIKQSVLKTRIINLNFPNYEQIIPENIYNSIIINKEHIIDEIRNTAILSDNNNKCIKIRISKNLLQLSSLNSKFGKIQNDLSVKFDGKSFTVGINYRYMIQALDSLSDKNVLIGINFKNSPIFITGETNKKHICIVMPMYFYT